MPVNKRSKYRGSRTCGGGTHKNRRGAGNRGGRGRAGSKKHHFIKYHMQGFRFGKFGFTPLSHGHEVVLDVGDLDQMAVILLERGIARQDGDAVSLDAGELGIQKVLGGGRVTRKLHITAGAFSTQAKDKIEEMGGQAVIA